MRSLFVLLALAFGGGYLALRHRPQREAAADVSVATHPRQIQSISLDGRGLPLSALRDALETKAGDMIDLARLDRDRTALETVLTSRGYLAAQVGEPRVTFGAGGAVFVTFAIEQGALFRIRNVTVTGATEIEAGVVTLGAGEPADAMRIAQARQALESRLDVRGKRATVTVKLTPDLAAGTVDVELAASRVLAASR